MPTLITLKRFLIKDFNRILLGEEIAPLGVSFGTTLKIQLFGFARATDPERRIQSPFTERTQIGSKTSGGVTTKFFADPGELEIQTGKALTSAQEAQVDTALNDHDATQLSVEQTRQDRDDKVDQPRLVTLLQQGVGTLTMAQRTEYLTLLGRLFLRQRDDVGF